MKTDESVIDFPKETLCPDVWHLVIDEEGVYETWKMISPVREKLLSIVDRLCTMCKFSQDNTYCHITGSITSNTYTENADVDLHILFKNGIRQPAAMTTDQFRSAFEQLKVEDPESAAIGSHPIEVYYQPNDFQDMMSIGCYDLNGDKWIVGPELKPMDYNPYDELYAKVKKQSASLVKNIRNVILDVYEKAVVMIKTGEHETPGNTEEGAWADLRKALKDSAKLYENARGMRRLYSNPTSKEQALKYRQSTKWKIADASFKLMDKFGYLAILKEFSTIVEGSLDGAICLEIADNVLQTVKHYINNADKLAEEDAEKVRESINEVSSQIKVVVEKMKPLLETQLNLLIEGKITDDKRVEYINDFKDYFGYRDDYSLKDTVKEVANQIAHECTLQMPTDTAAREVEGDAVMILMLKGNSKQAEAGKKLGDCMMHKTKHDDKTLLKHMREAYLKLLEIENDIEHKKSEQNAEKAENVNEGIKKAVSTAAIVALMAIPGILPKDALAAQLKGKPIETMTVNSPEIKAAVMKASPKKINGLNLANATNALARTIYAEAKSEGDKGQSAVASVIWNRSGGKSENMIAVISKPAQFSCWAGYSGSWTDDNYKYKIPASVFTANNKKIWDNCVLLAAKLISEEFTSTIGNRNTYMNKEKASQKNIDSWGQRLDLKIGKHEFGYLPDQDGFRQKKAKSHTVEYIVKSGDTLSKIAKTNNTTVEEIIKKNNIKDPNKISIGQKIRV